MAYGAAYALGAGVGLLVGFIVGNRRGKKKAEDSDPLLQCGPNKVGEWSRARNITARLLTGKADLEQAKPEAQGGVVPDNMFPTSALIVVLEECNVYRWEGDAASGSWVFDQIRTDDLLSFGGSGAQGGTLGSPDLPFQTRFTPSQVWPGATYPWQLNLPWTSSPAFPPRINPFNASTRICLGAECWPYARLSLADAETLVYRLQQKSWPLRDASIVAVALWSKGYDQMSRAVLNMYGGIYGIDKVSQQIQDVYQGRTGPMSQPTGAEL